MLLVGIVDVLAVKQFKMKRYDALFEVGDDYLPVGLFLSTVRIQALLALGKIVEIILINF